MASPSIFDYKASDFVFSVPNTNEAVHSNFDEVLISKWREAHDSGLCKYFLELQCKHIPGKKGYIAQMNAQRKDRRAPQSFHDVNMPFDADKFNFTKIKPNEILFQVKKQSAVVENGSKALDENSNKANGYGDMFIINVSPFAIGHALVMPNLSECRPQVLTYHALELGIEMQCLSARPNFYIVFNGMCAHASVNHLHLHCYYFNLHKTSNDCNGASIPQQSCLSVQRDNLDFKPVSDFCFICHSLTVPAIVFQVLSAADIPVVSGQILLVTQYLVKESIAHNLCMVKGRKISSKPGDPTESNGPLDAVRIFLWPRRKMTGAKTENNLNIAACELAGHAFLQPDLYDNITESVWEEFASNNALPPSQFDALAENLKVLLNA